MNKIEKKQKTAPKLLTKAVHGCLGAETFWGSGFHKIAIHNFLIINNLGNCSSRTIRFDGQQRLAGLRAAAMPRGDRRPLLTPVTDCL